MNTDVEKNVDKHNGNADVASIEYTRGGRYYRPRVDIVEREGDLTVLADMPGVGPDDVDVQFNDGVLTILGRVADRLPADTPYLSREYGVGDYYRSFQVSDQIDAQQISAEMANGVLTLHLPKAAAARPRKIAVAAK
ncbi:MAG: Hsp20/alpha crystallin family protein [Planctomycetes bacterium]|nr:Hsp20/alpha crystallin family protein [Planctomycetota bacterium]